MVFNNRVFYGKHFACLYLKWIQWNIETGWFSWLNFICMALKQRAYTIITLNDWLTSAEYNYFSFSAYKCWSVKSICSISCCDWFPWLNIKICCHRHILNSIFCDTFSTWVFFLFCFFKQQITCNSLNIVWNSINCLIDKNI